MKSYRGHLSTTYLAVKFLYFLGCMQVALLILERITNSVNDYVVTGMAIYVAFRQSHLAIPFLHLSLYLLDFRIYALLVCHKLCSHGHQRRDLDLYFVAYLSLVCTVWCAKPSHYYLKFRDVQPTYFFNTLFLIHIFS